MAEKIIEEGIQRDRLLANRIIWELSEAMSKKKQPLVPSDG